MNRFICILCLAGISIAGILLVGGEDTTPAVVAQSATEGCPETSAPESHTGTTLQGFADDSNAGVVFDDTVSSLNLARAGGLFQTATLAITDKFNTAAAADFDEDGWTDLVVGSSSSLFVRFYKNRTYENPAPDWDDPDDIRMPKFVRTVDVEPDGSGAGHAGMTSGDFNQDGHADFFYYKNWGGNHTTIDIQGIYLGNGDGTFEPRYNASTSFSDWGYFAWSSTNSTTFDWNRDGWPDIVFGTKASSSNSKGAVRVFLNSCPDVWTSPTTACSVNPRFVRTDVLTNVDLGNRGVNALTMADYTGDGIADLVVGAPSLCAPLRLYEGLPGGGVDTSGYEQISNGAYSDGAATVLLSADFSMNGGQDIIFGTDNWNCKGNLGGSTYFHKNDLGDPPFTGGADQRLTRYGQKIGGVTIKDFDLGVVLDYDNDPDSTSDFLIADGNNSGSFYVFANRVVAQFVDCGEVQSGVLDLGALSNEKMVVTSARLAPSLSLPSGTSATFYLSNEEPENWQLASPCVDNNTEYCVSFPKPVGRQVRWKAELCSNASKTATPTIAGMRITYDYTEAEEHYRAGLVVDDGVAYVGAFRQPGNRGHFYATNAALGQTYWDFAVSLDAMADSDRNVFTADVDGQDLLSFSMANAGQKMLQDTLGVASTSQAENVISWQRSARFGVGGVTPMSRLGSVETSTPAVVGAPGLPIWYPRADPEAREMVEDFRKEHEDRNKLVLFGSRDGALHAVFTTPTDTVDSSNGTEAWAFIPAKVANAMVADLAGGTETAYPDGSPTVADVVLSDGELHTVAIVAGGNGGKGVFALDITETVDEDDGSINGPDPLWHAVPGGAAAGQALSKPVVARVDVGGDTEFYAIMATGVASDNPVAPFTKGREVVAVDIATGAMVWQFQSKCAVTSDIVIFETDDDQESDAPAIDGFIDRAVWADACGNVYKVNPGQDVGTSFISGYGDVSTGHVAPDGNAVSAIFATSSSDCAIGAERPIVGTLGARSDATGRLTLFFGTGGIESYDPTLNNDFYAVYADTGEIRGCADGSPEKGRVQGTCTAGVCEKFYGGVIVTASHVIVTRASDAPVGTGTCEFGTSEVSGFSIAEFDNAFNVSTTSATVSSLYGAGGAVYFATLAGEIVRIGDPRAANAGDDTAIGTGGGQAEGGDETDGGEGAGDGPIQVLGWRQIQ
ncbi:MAG: hypothetical protein GY811_30390 [Myxococcales bacterium]|nr:hypothetical protein [Myxococcales bacterium]